MWELLLQFLNFIDLFFEPISLRVCWRFDYLVKSLSELKFTQFIPIVFGHSLPLAPMAFQSQGVCGILLAQGK